jgi:acyl-homoserine-lactone acylase
LQSRVGSSTVWFSRVQVALLAALVAAATAIAIVSAGGNTASAGTVLGTPGDGLSATIRTTSHGVPHIVASDFEGLGYGYGYVSAQANICVLADIYVTVNAERSRWFGPTGTYEQGGNGATQTNLNSDFFFQRIKDRGIIEGLLDLEPPRGPRPEIEQGVRGYVAGYNRWLRDTGVDNIDDPRCAGDPWVRPITEMDAYRRFYQLGLLASQGVAIDGIAGAEPPPGAGPAQPTSAEQQAMIGELGGRLPLGGIGSNMYGLGRDATDNGRGMVLGNPHFPWDGSERFFESQLTIPGQVNVSGGSLFGVPVINIGHTDHLAWSHTVSTAFRFTPFELRLVPGSPTTYIYDGQPRDMRRDVVTVTVRNDDGTLSEQTRTLYSSHHGSIFTSLLGQPLFPWTPTTAWAMGDANAGNFRYLNHFLEVNQAQSVQELREILERNQGIPWVNTVGADSNGDAFYADISVVPHVTNEKAAACNTELGRGTFEALGLPVLDGSLSACEWGSDPDAVEPGIFGPGNLPKLERSDYVTNSNDSYWLTNPDQPLEGFDRIIGDERTERSLRTRSGLVMVEQRLTGTDGRPGDRYTLRQLQDTVFSNRQYAGELWRDELAAFCEATPVMTGSSGPVDVSEACPVLRAWDLHDDLDSRGAILFRRFASRALGAVPVTGTPGLYTNQFDADDAVHTPYGLNVANPVVERSFADAVQDLRSNGIALDAPLGDVQYERRGEERIPIHGGPGVVGVFNAINTVWDPPRGNTYNNVPSGSSFVMAAQFTDDPDCPVDTRTILTYSQSTNPNSPYFADQTRMFSRKEWKDEAYCEDEIAADPNLEVQTISEGGNGFPRPKAASPVRVSLVPSYEECTAPNRTHGPPLVFPSCAPPRQTSDRVTVGTPDANGAAPTSVGLVRVGVQVGQPGPPDDSDVAISASLTDLRCTPGQGTTTCGDANSGGPADYTGELEAVANIRVTDKFNDLAAGGGTDPATVVDFPFPVTFSCSGTPVDTGGACSVNTTANAVVPGAVTDGQRAIVQLGQIRVNDGGPDGVVATADANQQFAVQGIFIP